MSAENNYYFQGCLYWWVKVRSANQWASEIPWASGASSGEFHGKHRCASLKWDGRCNTDIQVNFVNVRGCIERIDKVALLETSSDNNNGENFWWKKRRRPTCNFYAPWKRRQVIMLVFIFRLMPEAGCLMFWCRAGAKLWDKQFHSTYTIRYSIIGTLTCNKKTL